MSLKCFIEFVTEQSLACHQGPQTGREEEREGKKTIKRWPHQQTEMMTACLLKYYIRSEWRTENRWKDLTHRALKGQWPQPSELWEQFDQEWNNLCDKNWFEVFVLHCTDFWVNLNDIWERKVQNEGKLTQELLWLHDFWWPSGFRCWRLNRSWQIAINGSMSRMLLWLIKN